jgi:hypothetical protein
MKTYSGPITKLESNQVFCFGANYQGYHGAGSAGYASFNISGNHWREFDYASKPNGWKGKWNVKGVSEGFQEGTIGKSYAIPTVTRPGAKKSISLDKIKESIIKLYLFAAENPQYEFLVAQEDKIGLNGYSAIEMSTCWKCAQIPDNVIFEENFYNKYALYECRADFDISHN